MFLKIQLCILIFFSLFWLSVYVVLDFKVQSCYITVTFIKVHIIDLYIHLCVWTYELFDKIYSLVSMILFVNKYITQIKQLYIFDRTHVFFLILTLNTYICIISIWYFKKNRFSWIWKKSKLEWHYALTIKNRIPFGLGKRTNKQC